MSAETPDLEKRPPELPEWEGYTGYTNFDHTWDEGAKEALMSGTCWQQHAAWNFCGYMWRGADGLYRTEVWRHHAHIATVVADDPDDLVEQVNSEYGDE